MAKRGWFARQVAAVIETNYNAHESICAVSFALSTVATEVASCAKTDCTLLLASCC